MSSDAVKADLLLLLLSSAAAVHSHALSLESLADFLLLPLAAVVRALQGSRDACDASERERERETHADGCCK